MKRVFAVTSLTVALASAPSLAFAVNASSGDGSGSQSVSRWYPGAVSLAGSLRSTNGDPVYLNGTRVYDNSLDENDGRYVSNTSSRTSVSRGGTLGSTTSDPTPANRVDGAKFKVCRDRSNVPDPCGSNSSTMRR